MPEGGSQQIARRKSAAHGQLNHAPMPTAIRTPIPANGVEPGGMLCWPLSAGPSLVRSVLGGSRQLSELIKASHRAETRTLQPLIKVP